MATLFMKRILISYIANAKILTKAKTAPSNLVVQMNVQIRVNANQVFNVNAILVSVMKIVQFL